MARCTGHLEDGDVEDFEYPDADDAGADDDDGTVPCRSCGEAVYEDAERCPECGQYLSREDAPSERKPAWLVVGALLGTTVVLGWYLWH